MKGQRQAHSSVARGDENARDDWRTPAVVLDRVRRIGRIGLDPCGNSDNSTGARVVFSGPDGNGIDGLVESWGVEPSEVTFMNHPYSDGLAWAAKLDREAALGVSIIGLVPSRTDTAWWRLMTSRAEVVAFWRSRITFDLPPGTIQPKSPAPFPSALLFYNIDRDVVLQTFGDVADIYTQVRPVRAPVVSPLYSIIGRAAVDDRRREEERR